MLCIHSSVLFEMDFQSMIFDKIVCGKPYNLTCILKLVQIM